MKWRISAAFICLLDELVEVDQMNVISWMDDSIPTIQGVIKVKMHVESICNCCGYWLRPPHNPSLFKVALLAAKRWDFGKSNTHYGGKAELPLASARNTVAEITHLTMRKESCRYYKMEAHLERFPLAVCLLSSIWHSFTLLNMALRDGAPILSFTEIRAWR